MAITQTEPSDLHWNYFLALEKDLQTVSRYIELCPANFTVFSIELAHLLFAAASEVDVLAKILCEMLEPGCDPQNILDYQSIITRNVPALANERVFVSRYGLTFEPWDNWLVPRMPPFWWTSYNHVKHKRNECFHEATLENALRSMGGLLVLLFYTHRQILINAGTQTPSPRAIIRTLTPNSDLLNLDESYYAVLLAVN
jgi:hypothetical protein